MADARWRSPGRALRRPAGRARRCPRAPAATATRSARRCVNVSAGTTIDRTTNVSSRTPNAITNPISVRKTSGSTASAENVPASTMPADVITAPVTASPRSIPSRVRGGAPPPARGPSGRCCSRCRARRGRRTSAAAATDPRRGSRTRSRRRRSRAQRGPYERMFVATSIAGANIARSSNARIRNTTTSAIGIIDLVVARGRRPVVVGLRGRAADQHVLAAGLLRDRRGDAGSGRTPRSSTGRP